MKKLIAILLCLAFMLTTFAACTPAEEPVDDPDKDTSDSTDTNDTEDTTDTNDDEDTTDTEDNTADTEDKKDEESAAPVLDLTNVEAVRYTSLGPDDSYTIYGGDKLTSFFEEPVESFFGVCKYYEDNGWTLYNYNVMNGNHFATWTRGVRLVHIYWIECESELNLVTSSISGELLPPLEPEVTTGDFKTSVTQYKSKANNGMGYVVQLADGSFMILDGGYDHCTDDLYNTLVSLNGSEKDIVIRTWLITHSHGDHTGTFQSFASKYASKVKLETLMISPVETSGTYYGGQGIVDDLKKFDGANVLYVHTGMVFNYCNVKLEILFTGDELWIAEPYRDEGLGEAQNQNNSSIVFRIYTDDYSALFLGDASEETGVRMALYYGDYLKSDMCQVAHHGVEDFPLIVYRYIKAAILWYPCDQALYDLGNRDKEVRDALKESKYTKEIIIRGNTTVTREFGAGK